ncbi:MAG TPA: hypothetical protein VH596_01685 [Terriglobales bacterium]|jgi:hypothetical protein
MKSLAFLLVMCIFSAIGAAAQNSVGLSMANGYPQMLTIGYERSEGPARQRPLAQEQDLRETSSCTYARGERPLWEVMPVSTSKPLGDIAREFREERALGQKALIVWHNN